MARIPTLSWPEELGRSGWWTANAHVVDGEAAIKIDEHRSGRWMVRVGGRLSLLLALPTADYRSLFGGRKGRPERVWADPKVTRMDPETKEALGRLELRIRYVIGG